MTELIKELIWTHEGTDYLAKAIIDNDWKKLSSIIRSRLLSDCRYIDDLEYRREKEFEIQAKDYPPSFIYAYSGREDIRTELTYMIFKDNKGMTKELCASFWGDDGFANIGGFMDQIMEASGIPISRIRAITEEVPDENPTPAEA